MPKIRVLAQKMRPCTPPPSTGTAKRGIPFLSYKLDKILTEENRLVFFSTTYLLEHDYFAWVSIIININKYISLF